MDERIERHADVLLDHSLDVSPGDEVVVATSPATDDLAAAVCAKLGSIGAVPVLVSAGNFLTGDDRQLASYLAATDDVETPALLVELLESADAICHLRGVEDPSEFAVLADETVVEHRTAYSPVLDAALFDTDYTLAQVPTPGGARLASMGTDEFAEFVYGATLRDWDVRRRLQAPLAERVSEGERVRVRSGDETDVTFDVAGNDAVNGHAKLNLPGGEVYTAPVPDSVDGTITFDLPVWLDGRELRDVRLAFDEGDLVDYDAPTHPDLFADLLGIDDGSSRVGEFGIGTNPDLDRVTRNTAIDEKMHGTVHFALGSAYEATVGADNERNESVIHLDLLVDVREDGLVEIDGDVVQRDGEFLLD